MEKDSVLTFVTGFGQTKGGLAPLAAQLSDLGKVQLTSVYELIEGVGAEACLADAKFAPEGQSIYSKELGRLLQSEARNIVVSWSMGGLATLETAYFQPEVIDKFVIMGSTACFHKRKDPERTINRLPDIADLRAMMTGLKVAPENTIQHFFKSVFSEGVDKEILKKKTESSATLDEEILLNGLSYLEHTDVREFLPSIMHSALVIHGTKDEVIPHESGAYVAAHLPNCQLHSIEGADHGFCELAPGKTAEIIRSFVHDG